VIAAAGDIAADGGDQQATANLLHQLRAQKQLRLILMLGDGAYRFATMTEYKQWYEPTWGVPELKAITRAIAGNHEYLSQDDAHGYFDYWNGVGKDDGPAGPRGKGYYSFDVGGWHFIALNSNDDCTKVACGEGSPQLAWLRADLAAHPVRCTLLMVHAPRFQDGTHRGDSPKLQPAWAAMYDAGVDIVVAGHEHNYQQFAPMDKAGNVDRARGMRSWVVGVGGGQDYRDVFSTAHMAAEEKRIVNKSGILELTLAPTGYQWRFLLIDGSIGASGSDVCR
jgi:acid phosphatase type 7